MTAHSSLWVKGHGSKPSFPKAMPRRIPRPAGRTQQEHVSTCCLTLLLRCAVSTASLYEGTRPHRPGWGRWAPRRPLALGSLSLGPGLRDNNSDKHMPPSPATPTSAWQSPQIHALGVVPSLLPAPALGAGTHPPFQGTLCPSSRAKEFPRPAAAFSTQRLWNCGV